MLRIQVFSVPGEYFTMKRLCHRQIPAFLRRLCDREKSFGDLFVLPIIRFLLNDQRLSKARFSLIEPVTLEQYPAQTDEAFRHIEVFGTQLPLPHFECLPARLLGTGQVAFLPDRPSEEGKTLGNFEVLFSEQSSANIK